MLRKTFRQVVADETPLVIAGAFDALSARLIERTGFPAYFIGGFGLVGARYGVPDVGLKSLDAIAAGVRDIVNAVDLPVLVDCDDGYGDVKNVVHTMHTYERMGCGALMFEDQTWPKRCGHLAGKSVIAPEVMEAKIRAATSERIDPDTFIIARTDARGPHGLDDALRRAERNLAAGADALFIEAPESIEEMAAIGRAFDVPLLANPLEGGKTPLLTPREMHDLGFTIIPYGITLILRVARAMQLALDDIRSGDFKLMETGMSFTEYTDIVGLPEWTRIQAQHSSPDNGRP